MEKKRNKIVMVILIILLAFNLLCDLIFGLWTYRVTYYGVYDVKVELAKLITDNTIADTIWLVHNDFWAQIACFLISFVNLFYSIACLRPVYKEKASASKRIVGHWIYLIISLGAVVSSCVVFWTIFMCVLAG